MQFYQDRVTAAVFSSRTGDWSPLSSFGTTSPWNARDAKLVEQSFQVHGSYGSMLEGEGDELKRVFLEGNPYLLGLTMVVSLLHSLFDFLAFKNDIQFWNKNRSMEGLWAKSVVLNFVCQLIVFLYLLDNETSWMILARCQCEINQPANKSKVPGNFCTHSVEKDPVYRMYHTIKHAVKFCKLLHVLFA